jgi:hypothetical protein
MTTALVKYSLEETRNVGAILAKSGFFRDSAGEAQAVAKILAGQELGFGPMAAMTGIYIVDGRVTISANLMAASVKRSGKYNYRVALHTDHECEIVFLEKTDAGAWEEVGRSSMTMKEAVAAGLDVAYDKASGTSKKKATWQKFPKNMLFARAMSNGVKWYCPDIMGGPVYTPDEFDMPVNEDGAVIEGVAIEVGDEPPAKSHMKIEDARPANSQDAPEPEPPADGNTKVNREKGWNTDSKLITALRAEWPKHPGQEIINRLAKMEETDEIGRDDPQADVLAAYKLHMAAKK